MFAMVICKRPFDELIPRQHSDMNQVQDESLAELLLSENVKRQRCGRLRCSSQEIRIIQEMKAVLYCSGDCRGQLWTLRHQEPSLLPLQSHCETFLRRLFVTQELGCSPLIIASYVLCGTSREALRKELILRCTLKLG